MNLREIGEIAVLNLRGIGENVILERLPILQLLIFQR